MFIVVFFFKNCTILIFFFTVIKTYDKMAGRTRLHSEIMFGDNVPDDDISFKNPKKRILFDEETSKTAEMSEHMKCYLRIRPFSEEEAQNNEDQVHYFE